MSKERELLEETLVFLEMVHMDECDLYFAIEELLVQPKTEQEVVVYQYRTKPNWIDKWYDWENCSKRIYEDYKQVPLLHDWMYETREIYTSPPKRESLSEEVVGELLMDGFSTHLMDLVRLVEKAHGIGVDNE